MTCNSSASGGKLSWRVVFHKKNLIFLLSTSNRLTLPKIQQRRGVNGEWAPDSLNVRKPLFMGLERKLICNGEGVGKSMLLAMVYQRKDCPPFTCHDCLVTFIQVEVVDLTEPALYEPSRTRAHTHAHMYTRSCTHTQHMCLKHTSVRTHVELHATPAPLLVNVNRGTVIRGTAMHTHSCYSTSQPSIKTSSGKMLCREQ